MNEKEQEKGGKSNSGNAGSIAAGVLVPLILVAVIATLVVVTLIWLKRYISHISCLFSFSLYHRRCIQGLFGSPSATTSTTSKTVASDIFLRPGDGIVSLSQKRAVKREWKDQLTQA